MLAVTIAYLYPGIKIGPNRECGIITDANGARIESWDRPEPQPTLAEIEAAYPAALEAARRAAIQPVSRRKMLTALHRVGLLATIKAAVAASDDVELQIAFDEALDFDRNNAFIASMATALGKTDAEIDSVFALAASIE